MSTRRRRRLPGPRFHAQRGAGWGFFLTGVSVLLTVAAAAFLYIHQVTTSAVGGYDVASLERRVDELKEREQRLELHAAELRSLKAIEEHVKKLNLVVTDDVAYTSPLFDGQVALAGERAVR